MIMLFFKRQKQSTEIEINIPDNVKSHPAWLRLENQLNWYDSKSIRCQKMYKWLKFFQILLAVSIPLMSHMEPVIAKWSTSVAGASIAILEGIQHMNQYSTLWIIYRSTAERLKHEKFLFLSKAGPYSDLDASNRLKTLAERVEEHVSTEHAHWFNELQKVVRKEQKDTIG